MKLIRRSGRLHQFTIYMVLLSLLLMPLRGFSMMVTSASDDAGSIPPCHMHADVIDIQQEQTQDHTCCDNNEGMGCSHCFISMMSSMPDTFDGTGFRHASPVSHAYGLTTFPPDNLFKPPRSS